MDLRFENDVKMYGIQTIQTENCLIMQFENDVKMYGIQTFFILAAIMSCLRMM